MPKAAVNNDWLVDVHHRCVQSKEWSRRLATRGFELFFFLLIFQLANIPSSGYQLTAADIQLLTQQLQQQAQQAQQQVLANDYSKLCLNIWSSGCCDIVVLLVDVLVLICSSNCLKLCSISASIAFSGTFTYTLLLDRHTSYFWRECAALFKYCFVSGDCHM